MAAVPSHHRCARLCQLLNLTPPPASGAPWHKDEGGASAEEGPSAGTLAGGQPQTSALWLLVRPGA